LPHGPRPRALYVRRWGPSTIKANPPRGGGAKPMGLPTEEAAGPPKGATLAPKIPDADADADLGGTVVCPSLGADGRGGSERRRAVARLRGGPCVLPQRPLGDWRNDCTLRGENGLPLDGVAHDTRVPLFALDQDHTPPLRALCGERTGALATANYGEEPFHALRRIGTIKKGRC
jgi:hypothetical protein